MYIENGMKKWKTSDIINWLRSIHKEEYIKIFSNSFKERLGEKNVTGNDLYDADDEYLEQQLNVKESNDRHEMLESLTEIKESPDYKLPNRCTQEVTPIGSSGRVIPLQPPEPPKSLELPLIRLKIIEGVNKGSIYELTATRNIIGRKTGSDILTIADPEVSLRHCKLTVSGDHIYIKDLGSTGGTFKKISLPTRKADNSYVNEEVRLANGSLFMIGESEFKVILEDGNAMLKIYEGPLSTNTIILNKEVFTIGRGSDNNCCIKTDTKLSSKHASIISRDGLVYIQDRNSTNGQLQLYNS